MPIKFSDIIITVLNKLKHQTYNNIMSNYESFGKLLQEFANDMKNIRELENKSNVDNNIINCAKNSFYEQWRIHIDDIRDNKLLDAPFCKVFGCKQEDCPLNHLTSAECKFRYNCHDPTCTLKHF